MIGVGLGYGIRQNDWEDILTIFHAEKPVSIVEFGAGISTVLFYDYGLHLVCFESIQRWINEVHAMRPEIIIEKWDNRNIPVKWKSQSFDIAFIDGVAPRDSQILTAKQLTDKIIIHDGFHAGPWKIAKFVDDQDILDDWNEVLVDYSMPNRKEIRYFKNDRNKTHFGNGAISTYDWAGMRWAINTYHIKSVLEFGVGHSTVMFCKNGLKVDSLETREKWADKVFDIVDQSGKHCLRIYLWNNKELSLNIQSLLDYYDLCFIDGQEPRDHQFEIAVQKTDLILVHDGYRDHEKMLIEKYLNGWYEITIEGRCRLYERKR